MRPGVALVTFSTRPRGGAVHTLYLAESLARQGQPVQIFALGNPEEGFFRKTVVPHTICPAPDSTGSLEEKVFRSVDVLADHLAAELVGTCEIIHAQDCIAARAASRLRASNPSLKVVRTVHHIDDFSTQALVECQHLSILEPDHVLVVSRYWQRVLWERYRIRATVVTNGVDADRFRRTARSGASDVRRRVGAEGKFLFLTVGGIDPRKGSQELIEAMAQVKSLLSVAPVLVVVGGHSFRDHTAYRDGVLERARHLQLELGTDFILLGTVPDEELIRWYHAADAFVFPSVNEGWGLAVLEAMAAGLPVLATDIPVFREYLTDQTALLAPPGDARQLASAMVWLATDPRLRDRLARAGPKVAARFSWEACATSHIGIYRQVAEGLLPANRRDQKPLVSDRLGSP